VTVQAAVILAQVRPNWTVLFPVLLLAIALAIAVAWGLTSLYARLVYFPRIGRRILALDRRRASDGIDAVRGDLAVWERGVSKRDYNQLIVVARQWQMLGDHDRALAALDRIRWPWWFPTQAFRRSADELRYRVLREAGRDPGADELLNRALDRDPGAPWLDAVRLEKATAAADPQERLAIYERSKTAALLERPHVELVAKVAAEAIAFGRLDDAVLLSRRLLHQMQELEREPGGYVRTPSHLRSIAKLRAAIGSLLLGVGDEEGAAREFKQATGELADEEGQYLLAICRAEGLPYARRFDAAASAFEAIARDATDDVRAPFELAICRWHLGDPAGAREALARVRGLEPELLSIDRLEAMLFADEGKRNEAEAVLRPEDAPHDTFAVAYVRAVLGLPGAVASLRVVAALHPDDDPDVVALLDRAAPDGRTWRAHLDEPERPDAATQPSGFDGGTA
jgi:tetratricopeptide (TPR) repeat protein